MAVELESSSMILGVKHCAARSHLCPYLPPTNQCNAVVFQMYDADDDGLVTREDLVRQLLETNSRGMATDNVESIAQATLKAFDYDGDGALNYGEFVQLITSQRHVAA